MGEVRRIVILCKHCDKKDFWEYKYNKQNVSGVTKFLYTCKNCQAQSQIMLSKKTGLLMSVDLIHEYDC